MPPFLALYPQQVSQSRHRKPAFAFVITQYLFNRCEMPQNSGFCDPRKILCALSAWLHWTSEDRTSMFLEVFDFSCQSDICPTGQNIPTSEYLIYLCED